MKLVMLALDGGRLVPGSRLHFEVSRLSPGATT